MFSSVLEESLKVKATIPLIAVHAITVIQLTGLEPLNAVDKVEITFLKLFINKISSHVYCLM